MDVDSTTINDEPIYSKDTSNDSTNEEQQKITEHLHEYNARSVALKMAILAIFTALGPVLSISFIYFPYFELMTLTIFLGGIVLGYLYGSILAVLSTTLFEVLVSVIVGLGLPIYPFKLLAFILVALTGAFFKKFLEGKITFSWRILIASVGGLLTLIFDLLTTIGYIFFLDMSFVSYGILFLTGLPITAIRIATNTILFAFIPELYCRAVKPILVGKEKK